MCIAALAEALSSLAVNVLTLRINMTIFLLSASSACHKSSSNPLRAFCTLPNIFVSGRSSQRRRQRRCRMTLMW